MATTWNYFYPDVLVHVNGCPTAVIDFELRRAAQTFFSRSFAWQVNQPAIPVLAGTAEISVAPADTQTELVRIEKVWYDGVSFGRPATVQELDRNSQADWTQHTGLPRRYFSARPGVISLYPVPSVNSTTGLRLRLSVRPSEAAVGLDDAMAVAYRHAFIAGAKARLMMYPGKPWINLQQAGIENAAFESAIGVAQMQAARSFGDGRVVSRVRWC
jgi:hypothetical protein